MPCRYKTPLPTEHCANNTEEAVARNKISGPASKKIAMEDVGL